MVRRESPSTPPSSPSYPRGEWRNVSSRGSSVPLWVQRTGYGFFTFCLLGVIGWLIFLFFNSPDRTKVVAIGASTYSEPALPPNLFGLEDTKRFLELARSEEDVSLPRGRLTGEAINQIPNEIQLDGYQNLVVYVNLHAVALVDQDGEKSELHLLAVDTAPNNLSSGTGTALVSVKGFLKKLMQKTSVENILLLADIGRTRVDWRLGILDNNVADQLKEEVKELTDQLKKESQGKSLPNLQVICSTGPHEVSWILPKEKQSVFAYYVIQGLKGEADDEKYGRKDTLVSCNELFAYVSEHVKIWARKNRNATQTVQRFGAENDFDIFPVRTKQNARAVEEKEKSESVSDSSGGEKSQASQKNAKASKSDDRKKTNTKEKDKNNKPATPQDNAKHLLKRLATSWKHRDALRKEGNVALHSPHVWRALQSNLVRPEKLLRDGSSSEELNSEATKRLDAAENEFKIIDDRTGDYRKNSNDYSTLRQTSVAFQLNVKQNEVDEQHKPESTDQKAEQPDISTLVADVLESTPEKSDEANKLLIDVLKANTSAEGEIARQTIEQTLHCLNTSDRQKLGAVHRLLTLLRKDGRENASRDNQGPAELLLIEQLTAPEFLGDNPSDEVLQLSARAIALRQKLEKLIAENPDEVSRLQPGLDRALRAVTTGERWLLEAGAVQAGDSDDTKAGESFETAEKLVNALQDDVKSLRKIVLLRAELLAELPDYARWSADRLEGTSAALPGSQSGSLSSLAQVQSQVEFLDVFAGKLLKLMADLRRLESQLANAMTELRNNEPIPIALTRLSDQVSKSWETLQSDFKKEVQELLDEESVTSSTWPLIDSILQVPWIDAEDRSLLQEKLKRKLTPTNAEPKLDSRSVSGGWQAYWAIQTLALSGKNVDGLWDHWNEWISESTSSEQSQREKQAILGQEINKLFTEIRQDAYSTQRSNSSKPHARELLVRLADGWDYPQNLRDDPLVAIHKNRFRELMELRRNDWFLHRNRFHSLAQKYAEICRSLGSQPAGGESMPSVELLTQRLSFPSGASDDLTLRIDNFTNQSEVNSTQPRWKLLFLSSHAKIFAEGEAASELTSDDIKQGGERAYRVELLPEEERQSKLTIALVRIEGKEEFPVSIKHVTLIPPSDSSKWKIEFLASDEKQRMDRRNRSSSTSDGRNGQENSTTFGLPPLVGEAPKHYELIPYLTFPGGLSGGTVNVQAYLRSDQKRTVIAEANDVLLQTGENRVPLIFQKSRGEDPKGNSPLPISPT
ncbi:MAG: hypothetical protein IH899_04720, partial [Planctomycetes bacterium]|nr:hypothetical protein [Planctomycetota bacterium]